MVKVRLRSSFLVAALVLIAAVARADESVRLELHQFDSATISDKDLLTGHPERGRPVKIFGELNIPLSADGRVPVVVMLHGAAGILPYVTEWRSEFAAMGVATFIVDSFTPRGITSTIADQGRLDRLNAVLDAYRALALLRSHPDIDPERIILVGFSRGGDVALYSAMRRLRDMYGPGGAGFAAHAAFYPNCGTTYLHDTDVVTAPIRIFHGTADDYAPVSACRAYVARLAKAGADVRLKEYEGAMHVFMWKDLDEVSQLKTGQTTRGCVLAERDDGTVVNVKTGVPFTYKDACVELGPHVAYNAAAATDARKELKALVAAVANHGR
jgi:dienelactone hydrolase